jgi:hypothetical protein
MSHQMAIRNQNGSKKPSLILGLISALLASPVAFGLVLTTFLVAVYASPSEGMQGNVVFLGVLLGSAVLTAGFTAASIRFARRSRISWYRISSLLLGAAIAGLVVLGFLLIAWMNAGTS